MSGKGISIINWIDRAMNYITTWLNALGTSLVAIMMFLMLGDILGRVIFNKPIPGTPEIVSNSLALITFMQITYCLRSKRHIQATVILDRLPITYRKWIRLLGDLIGLLIFVLVVTAVWKDALRAVVTRSYDQGAIRIPTYYTSVMILVGSILMAIQFFINVVISFRNIGNKNSMDADSGGEKTWIQ